MTTATQTIPEGYKQTEIGVIPEDWDVAYLGDNTIKVGSGITPTGGIKVYKKEGRPFLRSQNIGWGSLLLDDIVFIDEATHATFQSTEIKDNDVFLNITGASIGRCTVANPNVVGGNVNQHVCIIRTDKGKLNPNFLKYFLLSKKGQAQIDSFQAGGNRQGLNFGQIRSFLITLPEEEIEQTAIATAISDADALIEKLGKLIEKKKNIKQGAMQELLTGRRRLPDFEKKQGYKETAVGLIPKDWDLVTYDQAFYFLRTAAYSRDKLIESGDCFYLHYGDIHTKWNYFLDFSKNELPAIGKEQVCNYSFIQDGDLVMADASEDYEGIGKSVEIKNIGNKKAISGLHTFLLRDKGNFFTNGFKGYIHANILVKRSMDKLATGLKVYGVSKNNLKLILIPRPFIAEQQAIVSILSDMDTEIEKLESQLAKYKNLKQGMMQKLLTGKIRLI